jgi:hypothetical protein
MTRGKGYSPSPFFLAADHPTTAADEFRFPRGGERVPGSIACLRTASLL